MMNFLRPIVGVVGLLLFSANTLFWFTPILVFSIIKLLLPLHFLVQSINKALNFCATQWISVNSFLAQPLCKVNITWPEEANFSTKDWYLVTANHQSWVDIYVLQKIFNNKIPFLKFFLKKELIYVPLLGIAWWALDFPFMKRHSKSYLKKNPDKKGSDLETTKQACEKFKHIPISVMNFAEGTRFTEEKFQRQNSPFPHLLKPKSGGIGTVLSILGQQMHTLVDVTIVYPDGIPTFWDFLSGKINRIEVFVNQYNIDHAITADMGSQEGRVQIQSFVNQIWQEKSERISHYQT